MMEHVFRIECPDDVAAAITVCRRKRAMEHRKQISKVHPLTGAPCKKQCKRDAAVPPLRRTTLAAVPLTQAKTGYGWVSGTGGGVASVGNAVVQFVPGNHHCAGIMDELLPLPYLPSPPSGTPFVAYSGSVFGWRMRTA